MANTGRIGALRFGTTLARAGGVIGRQWLSLIGLLLVFGFLPAVVVVQDGRWLGHLPHGLLACLNGLVLFLAYALRAGSVTALTLGDLRAQPLGPIAATRTALANAPRVLVATLVIFGLAVALRLAPFLIDYLRMDSHLLVMWQILSVALGLILLAVGIVYAPIFGVAVDRQRRRGSVPDRAQALSYGGRGVITGLHFLILIFGSIPVAILTFLGRRHLTPGLNPYFLTGNLVQALVDGLMILVNACVYLQMLRIKEGDDTTDVAGVFS